jgi:hypothetical protein
MRLPVVLEQRDRHMEGMEGMEGLRSNPKSALNRQFQ